MVNIVIVVGRLTNDVQLLKTQSGISFVRFNLACDRKKKDSAGNKQADFPLIKAFGKQAEFIAQYGHKGDVFGIVGHIATDRKEKDGRWEYYEGIVADSIQSVSHQMNVAEHEVVAKTFGEVEPSDLPF